MSGEARHWSGDDEREFNEPPECDPDGGDASAYECEQFDEFHEARIAERKAKEKAARQSGPQKETNDDVDPQF